MSIKTFAVILAVSALFTLILMSSIAVFGPYNSEFFILKEPRYIYFIIQFILLAIYLPIILVKVHAIKRRFLGLLLGISLVSSFITINIIVFFGSGFGPMALIQNIVIVVDISGSMDTKSIYQCWSSIDVKNKDAEVITFSDNFSVYSMNDFEMIVQSKKLDAHGSTNLYNVIDYLRTLPKRIDKLIIISDLGWELSHLKNSEKPLLEVSQLYLYSTKTSTDDPGYTEKQISGLKEMVSATNIERRNCI